MEQDRPPPGVQEAQSFNKNQSEGASPRSSRFNKICQSGLEASRKAPDLIAQLKKGVSATRSCGGARSQQFYSDQRAMCLRKRARTQMLWNLLLAGDWHAGFETAPQSVQPHLMRTQLRNMCRNASRVIRMRKNAVARSDRTMLVSNLATDQRFCLNRCFVYNLHIRQINPQSLLSFFLILAPSGAE